MTDDKAERVVRIIENCSDPEKLRQFAVNAHRDGIAAVARAAELRLYQVLPKAKPGSFEHDVWRSIYALEDQLTSERGKTTRLGRTRPKIAQVGELETVKDLILRKKASEGFFMLIDRQMSELTFEAVALRHPDRFDDSVLEIAAARLRSVGVKVDRLESM